MNNPLIDNKKTAKCDECGSNFYKKSSKMAALCPECSHILYGYEPCKHDMLNGKCTMCYWDGSVSEYIKKKISQMFVIKIRYIGTRQFFCKFNFAG